MGRPGRQAQAAGWLARVRRLLEETTVERVEQGFFLCASGFQQVLEGQIAAARTTYGEAARIGARFAYRQLGDEDGARMELAAADEVFARLGVAPDAARIAGFLAAATPASGRLTARELEVLRLIATGKTNRVIAAGLTISEKTVARHVSNIFTKLNLSSRSAATAYAYSHQLL